MLVTDSNLQLSMREDNKAVRLVFGNFTGNSRNNSVVEKLDTEEVTVIKDYLEGFVINSGKEIKPDDKAYTDDISYYKNEIERSLTITNVLDNKEGKIMKLRLTVYTDKEFDDHWLDLTPSRAKTLVELCYGYLNS